MVVIGEGAIDDILLPPLIGTIANYYGAMWPIHFERDISISLRRGTGFGAVMVAVRNLVEMIKNKPDLFKRIADRVLIVLDRKTEQAQADINKLIAPYDSFFLTIAVEEIEAWVLADREHVTEWLGISQKDFPESPFWDKKYRSEYDPDPKRTLNQLVQRSKLPFEYWDTGAANDFIEKYWRGNYFTSYDFQPWENWDGKAEIDMMKRQSPNSFVSFEQYLVSLFVPMRK